MLKVRQISRPESIHSVFTPRLNLIIIERIIFFLLSATAPIYIVNRHRVTHLRSDGAPRRESAGTGPVVLNEARVTGAAFSGITMNHFMCASVFLHVLIATEGRSFQCLNRE